MLLRALLVLLLLALPAWAAPYSLSTDGHITRFRLMCTRPHVVRTVPLADGIRWDLAVASPAYYGVNRIVPQGPIKRIEIIHKGLAISVAVHWRFPIPELRPTVSGGRFEFEIPEVVTRGSTVDLRKGVIYQRVSRWTAAGAVAIHILRLNLGEVKVAPRLAAADNLFARATVRDISLKQQALAAVNGSFFALTTGAPIGLLLSEGRILSSSFINRSVFGIRTDGTCFISQARLFAAIAEDSGKVYLASAVNRPAIRNEIVLYTPHWGPRTRTAPDPSRREFALAKDGEILGAATGNMVIPRDGYVVSAQGKAIRELRRRLKIGEGVTVYARLNGIFRGARFAIGGGPTLVQGWEVKVTAKEERFGPEIARGRAARTAIGYLGGTDLVLVTVDGPPRQRQPRVVPSVGMTLYEMARLMRELGCKEAINLDGGGSSTMVVQGRTVNNPSEGADRLVQNALVVAEH